jgi:ABC-type dipeptide/oligopeptide/nickel transport system permease subunit
VALGTVFGVLLGGLAGYLGRWVDTALMRVSDILFAFPGMLLMIIIAATLRPRVTEWATALQDSVGFKGLVETGYIDYVVVFGAMSFIGWAGMARLVRGQLLTLREQQFVEAAEAMGASPWRIIRHHLLPNAMPQVLVSVSMALGGAVAAEVVLSWLGIGVQPPNASWGLMISENQDAAFLPASPAPPAIVVAICTWPSISSAL